MSTPILPFALWLSGTNQNSLPANDNSLRHQILNGLVVSKATTAQPASPSNGDIYIIPDSATGVEWSLFDPDDLAIYMNGWYAFAPVDGIVVNFADSQEQFLEGSGGGWAELSGGGGGSGTVTSVDALGGLEIVAGSPITSSGTIRAVSLVNAQTGTSYTYVTGDRGKLVTHSNASAIAGTLPQATSTFGAGWFMRVKNKGAGTLTITPTTSTIDGATTLALTTGQSALIVSDGTNYQTAFVSTSGGGALTNFTEAVNSSTPNATIPVVSLTATNAAANVDVAIAPKGTGGFALGPPANGSTSGGNKRGVYAVDLQLDRSSGSAVTVATGARSFLQGAGSTASGSYAIGMGNTVTASGTSSFARGELCTSSSSYGSAQGLYALDRGSYGAVARANGRFASAGDAQVRQLLHRVATTNATATQATMDGASASGANQMSLTSGQVWHLTTKVVAVNTSTHDSKSWTVECLVRNDFGTLTIVGQSTTVLFADTAASAWTVAMATSGTNIFPQVTGAASTTIHWLADVTSMEVQ